MWCPACDGSTQVIDSRKYRDSSDTFDFVQRLRVCKACKEKTITIEVAQSIWENYYVPLDEENVDDNVSI
jgi:transcriptional regulator NrdR family protein